MKLCDPVFQELIYTEQNAVAAWHRYNQQSVTATVTVTNSVTVTVTVTDAVTVKVTVKVTVAEGSGHIPRP